MVLREETVHLLGYYDFQANPKVILPWEAANPFPEMTLVHEAAHRDLANTTSIGLITLATVRLRQERSVLPYDIIDNLDAALATLMDAQFAIQEGVATYVSMIALYRHAPERVEAVRDLLPHVYAEALAPIDSALGKASTEMSDAYVLMQPILYSLAKIALSPNCFAAASDLADCTALNEMLKADPPKDRFATLLAKCAGGALSELIAHAKAVWREELGEDIVPLLRRGTPDPERARHIIEFTDSVFRSVLHRASEMAIEADVRHVVEVKAVVAEFNALVRSWSDQLERRGTPPLLDAFVVEYGERAPSHFGFDVELVGDEDPAVPDCMLSWPHITVSQEQLESLFAAKSGGRWLLLIHIMPSDFELTGVFAHVVPWDLEGYSMEQPVSVETTMPWLEDAIVRHRDTRVFLKMDERVLNGMRLESVVWELPCSTMILWFDRRAEHIVETARAEARRTGRAYLMAHQLHPSVLAAVVSNPRDGVHWSALLPSIAWLPLRWSLAEIPDVVLLDKESGMDRDAMYAAIGREQVEIETVLVTTFLMSGSKA